MEENEIKTILPISQPDLPVKKQKFFDWPIILLGGVGILGFILLTNKKEVPVDKGFNYNCSIIVITNKTKFSSYLRTILLMTINSKNDYKNPKMISYFDFVRDCFRRVNKGCYDKYNNNTMQYNDLIIAGILFDEFAQMYLSEKIGNPIKEGGETNLEYEEYINTYFNPQWEMIMKRFSPITVDEIDAGSKKLSETGTYP